jgi:hypothetical protein
MKKLALILALMIIPCTAFGLEMLNDDAMDQVTGQSGVHIAFDDVQMFINIEKLAWIDCDGLDAPGCQGGPGAIVLNNFQIDVLNINAIVSTNVSDGNVINGTNQTNVAGPTLQLYSVACGDIPLFYDYGQTGQANCYLNGSIGVNTDGLDHYTTISTSSVFTAQALSIDVTDELPALTAGMTNNATALGATIIVGGVYIGLPTMEIYINSMSLTPKYDGDVNGQTTQAINDDNTTTVAGNLFGIVDPDFGTIYLEGVTVSILSGWMEIAPH